MHQRYRYVGKCVSGEMAALGEVAGAKLFELKHSVESSDHTFLSLEQNETTRFGVISHSVNS